MVLANHMKDKNTIIFLPSPVWLNHCTCAYPALAITAFVHRHRPTNPPPPPVQQHRPPLYIQRTKVQEVEEGNVINHFNSLMTKMARTKLILQRDSIYEINGFMMADS
jgi:hypothetical protein